MSQADNLAALATNVNSSGVLQPASGGTGASTSTGTGSVVLSNSPTLVTPVLGSASATQLTTALGSAAAPALTFSGDTNTGIFSPAADTIAFTEGGVESMRITSAGDVGIGTASPSGKFQVTTAALGEAIRWTDASNSTGILTTVAGASAVQSFAALAFFTNNPTTEKMRIDSSGNLQLGGTTAYGKATIGTGAGGGNYPSASTTDLAFGASSNRNILFLSDSGSTGTDGAIGAWNTVYNFQNSRIVFDKNAANTGQLLFQTNAGSGITERMRITSTGLVGIANSSPRTTLDVTGNIFASGGSQIQITGSSGSTGLQLIGQDAAESLVGTMGSQPLVFRTASTERFRIGPAGQLGIGGATYGSSGQVLTSQGSGSAPIWATASGGVTSVATGNGLSGGTITTTGTLTVACPGLNTVGSYCFGNSTTPGSGTIPAAGSSFAAGGGQNQVQLGAIGIDPGSGAASIRANNSLSGTWRSMGAGGNSGISDYGYVNLFCRIS